MEKIVRCRTLTSESCTQNLGCVCLSHQLTGQNLRRASCESILCPPPFPLAPLQLSSPWPSLSVLFFCFCFFSVTTILLSHFYLYIKWNNSRTSWTSVLKRTSTLAALVTIDFGLKPADNEIYQEKAEYA